MEPLSGQLSPAEEVVLLLGTYYHAKQRTCASREVLLSLRDEVLKKAAWTDDALERGLADVAGTCSQECSRNLHLLEKDQIKEIAQSLHAELMALPGEGRA